MIVTQEFSGNCVLNVEKNGDEILFDGVDKDSKDIDSFKSIIKYFDLDRDYSKIKESLASIDNNLKNSIEYGEGIRILNQDLFETIISFIISANNNIPRIKGIIERICKNYGNEIEYKGKKYYTFPTPAELSKASAELSKASVDDLRKLGLGFRDVRVYNTTKKIVNGKFDLNKLYELKHRRSGK